MTGVVKSVIPDRGFCFLTPDEGGPDVFAHVRDFDRSIEFTDALKGRRLEFDVVVDPGRAKARADNVRPVNT